MRGKRKKTAAVQYTGPKKSFWKQLVKQRQLVFLTLPAVVLVFIFKFDH